MAEQTFRSPGFFEQEIDATVQVQSPVGTPAGVIGVSQRGPAFVPVTVGSYEDFKTKFGALDPNMFGPYAVNEWLKNRSALTYLRVLGAGANSTISDLNNTEALGIVKSAGFILSASSISTSNGSVGAKGSVQFIVANHTLPNEEAFGYPQFTDNSSVIDKTNTNLVRGIVFVASGTRLLTLDNTKNFSNISSAYQGNVAKVGAIAGSTLSQPKYFKLVLSSTLPAFGSAEGNSGVRILSASLDPNDAAYIGKILNTDPLKFADEQHLLYADFSVEHDLAPVKSSAAYTVAVVSGSATAAPAGGIDFNAMFGRFDTRYTTARTTSFISQPFGLKEHDLFHFETLDDGVAGNNSYKVSIANLRASTDPSYQYGTFEVQVRSLTDTDTAPQIIERFSNCSLDPNSGNYVARMIGDKKVYFDFDQQNLSDRKLVVKGKYPNVSKLIRVVINSNVEKKIVPATSLPFGFRGLPTLKTTDTLTDSSVTALVGKDGTVLGGTSARRLSYSSGTIAAGALTGSIIPPMPFRFKVTNGTYNTGSTPPFLGAPGNNEIADARLYWGVNTQKMPLSSSTDSVLGVPNALYRTNEPGGFNSLISAYGKFVGIEQLGALVTGSAADEFNDNKFTLARVATSQTTGSASSGLAGIFAADVFTGSAEQIIRESAYVRDAVPNGSDYTVTDKTMDARYTLASLIATSSVLFNRFSSYAKFTNIFYGGFDGLDITDRDRFYFRDRALSSDNGGKADTGYAGPLGSTTLFGGAGRKNNNVASLNAASAIMVNPSNTNINILAIPGARDKIVTDNALTLCKDNGLVVYVMDTVKYDSAANRLYDDSTARPDPAQTSENFTARAVDNNYGATFFPDVSIQDTVNNRVVKVPSSIAALSVLGYSDKIAAPWFAPAGFNRASLNFVQNVETRLTQADRDTLYDARINPIASFPTGGFVIFGQKTLQQAKSSLDRINVRRLLIELKRRVNDVAQKVLFEPNDSQTRAKLVAGIVPILAQVQAQQGVESFSVVCDDRNNTTADIEANKMNCKIVIVPTRTIEFISIDFIVTNSGVQFV